MGEPTDGQKEIQALQSRILGLEETISQLKESGKKNGENSDTSIARIAALEKELSDVKKEKAEIQAKIWNGSERRAKERRIKFAGNRESDKTGDTSHDYIGGHFA